MSSRTVSSGTMRTRTIRSLVASAAVLLPLAAAGHTAVAAAPAITVTRNVSTSLSDFTNCPVTPAEVDCLGTQMFVFVLHQSVGGVGTHTSTAEISNFVVHFHADGSFEVEAAPFATGTAHVRVEAAGLGAWRVRGSVPLSDGTVTDVRVRLNGIGKVNRYADSGSGPEPGCPSGTSTIRWAGEWRTARVAGGLTIGDTSLVPTTAVNEPYVLHERSRGTCDA